jgi:two-component system, OmpR family, alkaline phosphatase synthesis response regulator PhoP
MGDRILIVDDEKDICQVLSYNLTKEGFQVDTLQEGRLVLTTLEQRRPALVILDWMLPDRSGIDILKAIRRHDTLSDIAVILLTARGEEMDRVLGLEMGADDYVTKPFSVKEVVARVKSLRRRTAGQGMSESKDVYDDGQLVIDPSRQKALVAGKPLELTGREFDVLYFLARNAGRVFSRDQLLDRVWGDEAYVTDRTVDVRVHRVRTALESAGGKADWIRTVRGKGYSFERLSS